MEYHCVLMSRFPWLTPPARKGVGNVSPSPQVLKEAIAVVGKCPEYMCFCASFVQSRRAFYHTRLGVFAVYFVRVGPVSPSHTALLFSHSRQKISIAIRDTIHKIGHTARFLM